jgi:uncharacterized membrane protein YhiD involved in acid resistance
METLKALSSIQLSFNWTEVVISLAITAALSLIVTGVYMLTHKDRGYEQEIIQTFVFLSMVVASVMLVIGNNLAGAFGLVGAVSIIRFRTRVENPQDTAYIFLSMAVGLSCGLKQYTIAILATVLISMVLIAFWKTNFARTVPTHTGNLLSVKVFDVINGRSLLENSFNDAVDEWDIVSIHAIDDNKAIVDYRIVLKDDVSSQSFMKKVFSAVQGQMVILRFEAA